MLSTALRARFERRGRIFMFGPDYALPSGTSHAYKIVPKKVDLGNRVKGSPLLEMRGADGGGTHKHYVCQVSTERTTTSSGKATMRGINTPSRRVHIDAWFLMGLLITRTSLAH